MSVGDRERTEYRIVNAEGVVRESGGRLRPAAYEIEWYDRHEGGRPHCVEQRTVSPWVPVKEEEKR